MENIRTAERMKKEKTHTLQEMAHAYMKCHPSVSEKNAMALGRKRLAHIDDTTVLFSIEMMNCGATQEQADKIVGAFSHYYYSPCDKELCFNFLEGWVEQFYPELMDIYRDAKPVLERISW